MKRIFFTLSVTLFSASLLFGSVYKGQRAYMRLCKQCHKSGGKLATSHTQSEWDDFFENDAQLLKKVHAKNSAAMKKIETEKFEKNIRHMHQFFRKYASDSGNVPACN